MTSILDYDFVQIAHSEHPFGHTLCPGHTGIQSIDVETEYGPEGIVFFRVTEHVVELLAGRFYGNADELAMELIGAEIDRQWPDHRRELATDAQFVNLTARDSIIRAGTTLRPHEMSDSPTED